MKSYTFAWKLWLVISRVYTKIFYPDCRLIRLPFDIRNRSKVCLGSNFTCGFFCRFEAYDEGRIVISNDVQVNDMVHITACNEVIIEANVLIASRVFISDSSHGSYTEGVGDLSLPPSKRQLYSDPVRICRNVWIGENVSILKGVTIGENSIIGAGSVVTINIPSNCIAVGVPAKVIKQIKGKAWHRTY
jgi:lipopolysaccharide O-acetyltransferase